MFEMTREYLDYIKSPRWKAVCHRYWLLFGKYCQACGSRDKLQVHHMDYSRFGREPMIDLKGLCSECHRVVHKRHRANRRIPLRLVTESYVTEKRRSGKSKP